MNQAHIAHFIRQHLNRSARALQPRVADRLAKARAAALARQKQPVHSAILASIGVHIDFDGFTRLAVSAVTALLLSLATFSYWHGQQHIEELEEVDVAILTDDLPLGALVDKGFDSWLQASDEQ